MGIPMFFMHLETGKAAASRRRGKKAALRLPDVYYVFQRLKGSTSGELAIVTEAKIRMKRICQRKLKKS